MKIIRQPTRSSTKKALLIAIQYHNRPESFLPETASGVYRLRNLLIDRLGYHSEDIIVMTDAEDSVQKLKPIKLNILREIRNLVANATYGDHFLFYFAGHSDQMPCKKWSEDDNKDEVIVCADFQKIKDNKLRKMLVNTLPNGASLTAIFDACYSGTLLDLEHYACNNVWVPWLNKGKRKSDTIRNNIRRQNAMSQHCDIFPPPIESESETNDTVPFNSPALDQSTRHTHTAPSEAASGSSTSINFTFQTFRRFQSLETVLDAVNDKEDITKLDSDHQTPQGPITIISATSPVPEYGNHSEEPLFYSRVQCSSPENLYSRYCDGICRGKLGNNFNMPHPYVVSLSSSQDSQVTWEDTDVSMTGFLIQILEKTPSPSYHHLMTELQHKLHGSTMEMHRYAKDKRRKRRGKNESTGEPDIEMNDFQDPQLGSITPLNMDDIFIL